MFNKYFNMKPLQHKFIQTHRCSRRVSG